MTDMPTLFKQAKTAAVSGLDKIGVLVVDDSSIARSALSLAIEDAPDMELVGAVRDPIFAKRYMTKRWPDVIIMELSLPRMDGIEFMREVVDVCRVPTIVCSSKLSLSADTCREASELGATEFIPKPGIKIRDFYKDMRLAFLHAIRQAAKLSPAFDRSISRKPIEAKPAEPSCRKTERNDAKVTCTTDATAQRVSSNTAQVNTDKLVAIGASTGGTRAIEELLKKLPQTSPGIVIVQHMPERFTSSFASRLNEICNLRVKEAENGDVVESGVVLIAPGDRHMILSKKQSRYCVALRDGELVNRHKPSVNVLFDSVSMVAGKSALGMILTGMGNDGAEGLLKMRAVGAKTLGQSEKSCLVYGMPKEAFKLGAVEQELDLDALAESIVAYGRL